MAREEKSTNQAGPHTEPNAEAQKPNPHLTPPAYDLVTWGYESPLWRERNPKKARAAEQCLREQL